MEKIYKYEPLWGDWLIDEKIGEGSYGKVYRICRENNGNTYYAAVKIITIPQSISEISALASEGMDEDSISAYFRDVLDGLVEEIDLLYSFRGLSNIVNIDDYKVIKNDDNVTYDILIKMELLKDITSFVQSTPLTKAEVFKLALDMCKALEVCHKKNIIHRDIKPDNMFVSEHGDYKLGDFGVARKMEKTLSGLSKKGTYLYMAPEVFKGEDYNHTVDIYSLGIVIYRFLNGGKLPFFSSNQIMYRQREEALAKRLRGEPVPYPESGEGQFESIILKACSYNPKDRYQNIKELKEALSKVVMDSLESAMITTSPQKKVGEAKTDAIQTNKSQKEFKTDVANNDAQNNNVLTDLNPGTIGIDKMTKTQLIDDTSLRKNKSIFEEEISKLEQKTDFQLESDSLITQSKDSEVTYIDNKLKKGNVKKGMRFSANNKWKYAIYLLCISVIMALGFKMLYNTIFSDSIKYNAAINYYNERDFEESSRIFSDLGDFKNSIEMKNDSDYLLGIYYFENKDYEKSSLLFSNLSILKYKDSEDKLKESIYQLALSSFLDDENSLYAREKFQSIIEYKDSSMYALMITDNHYKEFYSSCSEKGGYIWYVLDSPDNNNSYQTTCQIGINGNAGISFSPYSLHKELVQMEMSQSGENRYIFARILGVWESSDKKIKIDVYLNQNNILTIKLYGLVFSQSIIENGEKFVTQEDRQILSMRDDKVIYTAYYSDEFASVEFLNEFTMRFTTLKIIKRMF
jgi:serine/threonine protein kinase